MCPIFHDDSACVTLRVLRADLLSGPNYWLFAALEVTAQRQRLLSLWPSLSPLSAHSFIALVLQLQVRRCRCQ